MTVTLINKGDPVGYNGSLYLTLKGVARVPYLSSRQNKSKNGGFTNTQLAQSCSVNLKVLCWLVIAIEHRVDNTDAYIQIQFLFSVFLNLL